ncbi:MAG: KEOPS complex subunit Cgi121 [Archaeoglobaceae archaeon]
MRVTFGEVDTFGDFATLIDPRFVPDLEVVSFAAEKALKAWNRGERISRSLALEVLLYYAATRQIREAVKLGAKGGRAVIVVIDEEEFSKRNFRELDFKPEIDERAIMEHYGITEEELKVAGREKLSLLIRERIALFAAFKE